MPQTRSQLYAAPVRLDNGQPVIAGFTRRRSAAGVFTPRQAVPAGSPGGRQGLKPLARKQRPVNGAKERENMAFCKLFYHIVWTTKNRQPLLTPEIEPIVYNFLRTKAIGLEGTVFAIGGIADHVHIALSIPAKIAVATFIGQIKGVTSARFNQEHPQFTPLYWQDGYGAFSVDGKRLPHIIAYIEGQKQHHAQNDIIPVLERVTDEQIPPILHESAPAYVVDDKKWWQEMVTWDEQS